MNKFRILIIVFFIVLSDTLFPFVLAPIQIGRLSLSIIMSDCLYILVTPVYPRHFCAKLVLFPLFIHTVIILTSDVKPLSFSLIVTNSDILNVAI